MGEIYPPMLEKSSSGVEFEISVRYGRFFTGCEFGSTCEKEEEKWEFAPCEFGPFTSVSRVIIGLVTLNIALNAFRPIIVACSWDIYFPYWMLGCWLLRFKRNESIAIQKDTG